jgi:hypothetical protein
LAATALAPTDSITAKPSIRIEVVPLAVQGLSTAIDAQLLSG